MDVKKTGKFIAACRKEQHMTQAELAEKLGISNQAVSKWETGRSMPDAGIMLALCGQLGISVNELLSGEKIIMTDYQKQAEENQLIDLCRAVICTAEEFGPYNEENRRLREYAAAQGKLKSETQAIQEVLHEC